MGRLTSICVWILLASACDPGAPIDPGPDGPTDPIAPMRPDAVMPPALGPCPEGFVERALPEDATIRWCDPFPDGGAVDCTGDQAHFVGEPGCARVGSACPEAASDGFPVDLPTDGTTIAFVRAGATGGDGSRAAPFGTIVEATVVARGGGIVAIAPGEYDGGVAASDLTLWGACVAGVHLFDSTPSTGGGVVLVQSGTSTIRGLRITGAPHGIVGGSADIVVEDVVIEGAGGDGIRVVNAREVVVRNVVVRDPTTRGAGIRGQLTERLEVSHVVVERSIGAGIVALGVPDLSVTRTVLRGVLLDPMSNLGSALVFADGTEATVAESYLEGADLVTMERQAGLVLRDVVLRPSADPSSSFNVSDATRLTLERVLLDGHTGIGVGARSTTGTPYPVVLRDVIVRDGASIGTFYPGFGVELDTVATTVERLTVFGSAHVGVRVVGGTIDGTDVRVEGVAFDAGIATLATGGGFLVNGAPVHLDRVRVRDVDALGLVVADTTVDLANVTVDDVRGIADTATSSYAGGGMGVTLARATGTVRRVAITSATQVGVAASPGAAPTLLEDLTVTGTRGSVPDGRNGWGLAVFRGGPSAPTADYVVQRIAVSGAREAGIYVGEGMNVTLDDVVVEGTLEAECGALGTCTFPNGTGVAVISAHVDLSRALLRDCALAGLYLETGGSITARYVRVEDNRVGIAYWDTVVDPALMGALALAGNDTDVALAQPWMPMAPTL